ncbi:hypothetical protein JQ557_15885 [Bradyrhizobium sp. U87765 SZCCT0131]|uniref:hypothetical protein n=1 Tax=unclassified Bradyrhizobium TaxID=2631580 RepID=UPI001BA5EA9C|nr:MULTISPECIES: hypothetical protein [unclassified Bradyrhizobium]MBR1219485.1 hypothetical protein [Bradyrhizobium sp. U87765 SZCCT0131]MBR1262136.1 hypothetical protein [Bradyrhizobium sp. U87765 SZCCT0134]MBR1308681.1 hypothetical protein [Bradyrhizobium sp. U87765 SZCCT0110]MBR1317918.1 hypothetical protein [Bradyrhizobium sp. U87765 SZCCT0109]MBR1351621.1 hypothetical protein [Bradyrhizobium sp. U87765 SZCCT0048]
MTERRSRTPSARGNFMDEVRGALDQFEKQERELRDDGERRAREEVLTRILEQSRSKPTA